MMYVKVHLAGDRCVIAVCDESLLGKAIEEGEHRLKVSDHFFKGEKKTEDDVVKLLQTCNNANLIGEEAVNAGIKAGVVTRENVMTVGGVPHAQAFAF